MWLHDLNLPGYLQSRVIRRAQQKPADGSALAVELEVSKSTVQRILAQANLRPHRLDPVLPLSPGRAERHGFEDCRHGTLSLYAALNVKTGQVEGRTAQRHTSAEFVTFLTAQVSKAKWAREIHIVLDNLSAHKTDAAKISWRSIRRYDFTSRLPTPLG